ncbi:hypothetical protein [Mitsuaria sp. GD03876]|uniref:hypothetical protein n=1 Tax=Mitsuaria sp. GD03876 TaxID=2975399 RepID=UPI002446F8F3|nr:hypothetical protein [Mitsuaria sp. GD03876]MDH0863377.1 hypothetical protein [Mitsuaria sp. GD03876]
MTRGIKWFAWLALAVGIVVMADAGRQLLVADGRPPSGLSCRALCGLSLIAAELLGEEGGQRVLAALWFAIGLGSAVIGVKLIKTG